MKDLQTLAKIGAFLVGAATVLGLVVAVIGLSQSASGSESQTMAQATLVSILQEQLGVQREMATIAAGGLNPGPTATAIARRAAELESTAVALTGLQANVEATLTAAPISRPPTAMPQAKSTEVPPAAVPPTAVPPTATSAPTSGIGTTQVSNKDGMVMVYVPAGDFAMGSDISPNESPEHQVYLDAFWLDQTEVTTAMFKRFVDAANHRTNAEIDGWASVFDPSAKGWQDVIGASWQHPRGPSSDLEGPDNYPVVQMSWYDAKAYCEWAGRRLPTEAEWEKAARSTDGRMYPWGNQDVAGDFVNIADQNLNVQWAKKDMNDGYQYAAPVGHYPNGVSPYGAYDMAGNVQEWVADWYDENYYASSPNKNPTGPTIGQGHVLRGGGWNDGKRSVRTSYRNHDSPEGRSDSIGFRCARSAQ